MSIPDFEKAEYEEPAVIDGDTGYLDRPRRPSLATFPLAIFYGVLAGIVGSIGYALFELTGIMVSIVTIGIGYIVARAMMTATRGIGGQPYQIAAVALTYFSSTMGEVLNGVYHGYKKGMLTSLSDISPVLVVKEAVFGPLLDIGRNPGWGVIGLLILFYGLRTAWQMAAGSPGFGQQGGPRMTAMGLRR